MCIINTLKADGFDMDKRLSDPKGTAVRALKFSPSGDLLAVASASGKTFVYDCLREFKLMATCAAVAPDTEAAALDFTADGRVLRVAAQPGAAYLGRLGEGEALDAAALVGLYDASRGGAALDASPQ